MFISDTTRARVKLTTFRNYERAKTRFHECMSFLLCYKNTDLAILLVCLHLLYCVLNQAVQIELATFSITIDHDHVDQGKPGKLPKKSMKEQSEKCQCT